MSRLFLLARAFFIPFYQILAEMFEIVICTDHYQFVKWIEAFFSSRYINPLFSPDNCHDVDIALLAEVEFFQGFPHAGRVLLHFEVCQVKIAFQQVIGKPLLDRGFPFVFQFAADRLLKKAVPSGFGCLFRRLDK